MRAKRVDSNQKKIVAELRWHGWAVALMHRAGEGFPDLVVSRSGWGTYLVEVKVPGKKPNARQELFYQKWLEDGGEDIHVITSALECLMVVGFQIKS